MRNPLENSAKTLPDVSVYKTELPQPKTNTRGTHTEPPKSKQIERKLVKLGCQTGTESEMLQNVREKIVDKKSLYAKYLLAWKKKLANKAADATCFTEVGNTFIVYCEKLNEKSIESTVDSFNKKFFDDYVGNERKNFEITFTPEELSRIIGNPEKGIQGISTKLDARGIISVLKFIKARRELFKKDPTLESTFSLDNVLDALHKIDLVESIYKLENGERVIDTINLIQIKSEPLNKNEPEPLSEREIEEITKAMKEWATSSSLNLTSFKQRHQDGIPDNLETKKLLEDAKGARDAIIMAYLYEEDFNKFLSNLNFGKVEEEHKLYLIIKYLKRLQEEVPRMAEDKKIDEGDVPKILKFLKNTEKTTQEAIDKPRSWGTKKVNSVIAVGSNIVSNKPIF